MPFVAKRMKAWSEKLQPGKQYPVDEALKLDPRHLRALNLKRKIQRAVKILGGR